jgi:hypothetical protein
MYKRFLKLFDNISPKVLEQFTIEIDSKELVDHTGNEDLTNTNWDKRFCDYMNQLICISFLWKQPGLLQLAIQYAL